jgi:hypothetical protein
MFWPYVVWAKSQFYGRNIRGGSDGGRTLMSSFLFLAMIFCCSVLYGLLRRFNTSRALPPETTLVARETPFDATMMVDAR